jgi:hypothetical protein
VSLLSKGISFKNHREFAGQLGGLFSWLHDSGHIPDFYLTYKVFEVNDQMSIGG